MAFNGSYLVVWNDERSGTESDVYGARVATNGAVQDTTGFLIASEVVGGSPIGIVKAPGNKWAISLVAPIVSGAGVFTSTVAPK